MGSLQFESGDNEPGRRGGKETGSRKRQMKKGREKIPEHLSKTNKHTNKNQTNKQKKPKKKVKKPQVLAFQRMENCSLSWVRHWDCPLRRRRRGDTEIHQASRGAQAPGGFSEAFGGLGLWLGQMWVWHTMGQEGQDRAGDRRLKVGFDIWQEPGKTGSNDQAGLNVWRESEPGGRK